MAKLKDDFDTHQTKISTQLTEAMKSVNDILPDENENVIIEAGSVGTAENIAPRLPPILHLNGPEYGAGNYTASTNTFHNDNIGVNNTSYHYDTQESLNYLASRGWRYVKVPIRWERIQGVISGDLRTSHVALLTRFMNRCHKAGLKVIIDIHNYGLYYRNVNGTGTRTAIGDSSLPISAFADLWRKLAIQYKDHPATLGYAVMAEPQGAGGLTGPVWRQASQEAVAAIREVDSKSEIHVAGFGWSSLKYWESYNGASAWINDTSGGIIRYEAHHYFDADSSGDYASTYQQDLSNAETTYSARGNVDAFHTKILIELRTYNDWLERNKVSGIIGEMGWIAGNPDWEALGKRYLKELHFMGIPAVPWCTGEWTDGDNLAIYGITNYTIASPKSQALVWEKLV